MQVTVVGSRVFENPMSIAEATSTSIAPSEGETNVTLSGLCASAGTGGNTEPITEIKITAVVATDFTNAALVPVNMIPLSKIHANPKSV